MCDIDYCAGKMRSREYTVVLAIAMMDGSFNVDRQNKKTKRLLITGVAKREVVCIEILQGRFSYMQEIIINIKITPYLPEPF